MINDQHPAGVGVGVGVGVGAGAGGGLSAAGVCPRQHTEPVPSGSDAPESLRSLNFSGRWVWRGRGGHAAHLIRERSICSSNPWTLCGRRLRQPRSAWRGTCPTCRSRASELADDRAVDFDAEPIPPREVRDETNK